MDRGELLLLARSLAAETEAADSRAAMSRARAEADEAVARDLKSTLAGVIRQLVRLDSEVPDDLKPWRDPTSPASLHGKREQRILDTMAEKPDSDWSVQEVVSALTPADGSAVLPDEVPATRTAMHRLVRKGTLRHGAARGRFRLSPGN